MKRKLGLGAVLFLLGLNIFIWPSVLRGHVLTVTFFDVGQGDSIFIESPQGHQILIDGGPDSKVVEKLGSAMPFWDKSIDLVMLTHPEKDHVAGLVSALEAYDVKNVLWTGVEKDTQLYGRWVEALLNEEDAVVTIAEAPQTIIWSKEGNSFIDILYPFESSEGETPKKVNDTSIIAKLVYGEDSFLFTGDISKDVEKKLILADVDFAADVLKVAHHGSKTSSMQQFIQRVAPQFAVIHVGGENRYGHPNPEVLERFSDFGIPVLRTDQNGDIVLRSNGNTF